MPFVISYVIFKVLGGLLLTQESMEEEGGGGEGSGLTAEQEAALMNK